ncbi:MAG TPA: DUF1778 domain-containing protein [Saprospiraceae bacterium]|nr:DUF1778 domain-containing protein [Saprospiraceae bacterium]HNT20837.1 DUF1778 domain-containing protein [Saprospiraceae bacterium]
MTRFDTRLTKEQKLLFKRAAMLGGYRNLSDFVITTVQNRAVEIIETKERIIASQRDLDIFFEAITRPAKPNKALRSAARGFKSGIRSGH